MNQKKGRGEGGGYGGGRGVSSPRHEGLAAVRDSEEERGCGVGGGERRSVGVALTRYIAIEILSWVVCLSVCFVPVVLSSNFARTNRGLLAASTGDKEKKKKK